MRNIQLCNWSKDNRYNYINIVLHPAIANTKSQWRRNTVPQAQELDVYFHSKRATKGVDVLYQYRVAVHPMGNLELDLTKTQKTTWFTHTEKEKTNIFNFEVSYWSDAEFFFALFSVEQRINY